MTEKSPRTRITPAQWDALRIEFHNSLMIDTSLTSLAQNIDGCVWVPEGADEKPSAYIDLTHAEVLARLDARGLPIALLDDLVDILRGTLAFDEALGDMVDAAGTDDASADPLLRALDKLGIPASFPVDLCAFTPERQSFCVRENIHTFGEFLSFARSASRYVTIGGEFRELLNSIAHTDEQTLARYLPYRPRTSGLHLVESFGLLLRPLSVEERLQFARRPEAASSGLRAQATRRVDYFAPQAAALTARLAQGASMARLVVPLDDLSLEAAVGALLALHLAPPPPVAPIAAKKPERNFLHRLLKRGRGRMAPS